MRRLAPSLATLFLLGCSSAVPPAPRTVLCGHLLVDRTRVAVVVDLASPKTWVLDGARVVSLTLYPCRKPGREVAP